MSEESPSNAKNTASMKQFMQHLLADVQALEYMLDHDWFEKDITRIGAEQEMVLINQQTLKPAPVAMEALAKMTQYDWVVTELAKFNLEANLLPQEFTGDCFQKMKKEQFVGNLFFSKNGRCLKHTERTLQTYMLGSHFEIMSLLSNLCVSCCDVWI